VPDEVPPTTGDADDVLALAGDVDEVDDMSAAVAFVLTNGPEDADDNTVGCADMLTLPRRAGGTLGGGAVGGVDVRVRSMTLAGRALLAEGAAAAVGGVAADRGVVPPDAVADDMSTGVTVVAMPLSVSATLKRVLGLNADAAVISGDGGALLCECAVSLLLGVGVLVALLAAAVDTAAALTCAPRNRACT
jgi:hypothetical protein